MSHCRISNFVGCKQGFPYNCFLQWHISYEFLFCFCFLPFSFYHIMVNKYDYGVTATCLRVLRHHVYTIWISCRQAMSSLSLPVIFRVGSSLTLKTIATLSAYDLILLLLLLCRLHILGHVASNSADPNISLVRGKNPVPMPASTDAAASSGKLKMQNWK